jgi:hypothetical protein
MSGFKSIKNLVESEVDLGQSHYATWRKSPTQITTSGVWFDLALSPGNPAPFYYASAPYESVGIYRSINGGMNHGQNVSPAKKVLRKVMALATAATALPLNIKVLDYLMYYPFIDESLDGEEQLMTNTATLPRFTDGKGVQIMAVVVAGHATGLTQSFVCSYTNQDGVSGRITTPVFLNNQFVNGTIITTSLATVGTAGPFIPLQSGDSGVRSIESLTMTGSDVGLMTLVLVKPLGQMSIVGIDAPVEVDYLKDFSHLPEIQDNAYINLICCPVGSLAATAIHGEITTSWSN